MGYELFHDALELWGKDAQINQAIEEMAELIVALNHDRRVKKKRSVSQITEELVDVEFMLDQVKYIYNMDISELRQFRIRRESKLERMISDEKKRRKEK